LDICTADVKAFSDSRIDISKIVSITTHGASITARKEAGFATPLEIPLKWNEESFLPYFVPRPVFFHCTPFIPMTQQFSTGVPREFGGRSKRSGEKTEE
jgi:hypothetical protein